jgi:hypothetical protein
MKKTLSNVAAFVICVFIGFQAFAGATLFLKENSVMTGKDGDVIAEMYFGTPAEDGVVTGWMQYGDNMMYSDDSGRLTYGKVLDKTAVKPTGRKHGGMRQMRIRGELPPELLSSTREDALMSYEKNYYEICSSCHAATLQSRYSVEQWEGILNSMRSHAHLSDNDTANIYRYIKLLLLN